MTRNILIAAVAAAATVLGAATSFTTSAEAGGVRVGFGFPLGSFVASPTRGGYGGGSAQCKKKPRTHVARKAPRHEPRVASRPSKETKVAAYTASKPKKPRTVERAETEEVTGTETSEETEVTSSGSTALLQGDQKAAETAAEETETIATETVAANTAEETPAELPAVTETSHTEPVVVEEVKTSATDTAEPTKVSKKSEKEECKKYIPSIGVTISVGCK
ncbi:MAG: hypothetical protein ACT4N2_10125 [Hyphomicrobium sp.]